MPLEPAKNRPTSRWMRQAFSDDPGTGQPPSPPAIGAAEAAPTPEAHAAATAGESATGVPRRPSDTELLEPPEMRAPTSGTAGRTRRGAPERQQTEYGRRPLAPPVSARQVSRLQVRLTYVVANNVAESERLILHMTSLSYNTIREIAVWSVLGDPDRAEDFVRETIPA